MKTILVTFLFFNTYIYSQWLPDLRLTNDTSASYISYNNASSIATNGNLIHVLWYDSRNGNDEIYYKRSTDGGTSWGADMRLTNNSAASWFPAVAIPDSGTTAVVHIAWQDIRDGNAEIYYKRSTDGGISWETDIRLTNNSSSSQNPSISISGNGSAANVHAVWYDLRDGNYEIYYKNSTDGGENWGPDLRITNNSAPSMFPSITVSGSILHIVWHDIRDGNYEIYYKRSSDGGLSWSADTRLTNSASSSWFPSIKTSGSGSTASVHVVWYDNRDGNDEIYYKQSLDGGISWGGDTRLTNNFAVSGNPSVSLSGTGASVPVHVVWSDNRDGNFEIYYKRSIDGGSNWGIDTRLTNLPGLSSLPGISVSGQGVHVVWNDNREGNFEIYYKKNPTGNPLGIISFSNETPGEFKLTQNYPNPFNPKTKFLFGLPKAGYVEIKVFNIAGREAARILSEFKSEGSYTIEFDASALSSGIYFYTLKTNEFTITKKMLLVK